MGNFKTFAYLGPKGTHSELALGQYSEESEGLECSSIAQIFEKVNCGEVDAGFIPTENIIQGPVTETLDSLLEFKGKVYIADSFVYSVVNCFGTYGSEVKQVLSHSQPLHQCSKYLDKNFPDAKRMPMASTSDAIRFVVDNDSKDAAVIGAKKSLEENGFKIVDENISNIKENKTRFIVIRKGNVLNSKLQSKEKVGEDYVTSIVVDPGKDRQGLLFELLEVISVKHGVNLLSIHSRPDLKGGFVFFLDLEGHASNDAVVQCLDDLKTHFLNETGGNSRAYNFWIF